MKKRTAILLLSSHLFAVGAGFSLGIYVLPILTAPPAPDLSTVQEIAVTNEYAGKFSRNREDSDAFHWGEGEFSIGSTAVTFMGELAPGPDYKLYLSPEFVETEKDFLRLKDKMVRAGEVKTFENFLVPIQDDIDPSKYNTAIVWCESFEEFITSGTYQRKTTTNE